MNEPAAIGTAKFAEKKNYPRRNVIKVVKVKVISKTTRCQMTICPTVESNNCQTKEFRGISKCLLSKLLPVPNRILENFSKEVDEANDIERF